MPFACPFCASPGLEIAAGIDLPSDSRSDEISLQVVECSGCGFAGLAVYQESRRGALGHEVWEHTGYRVRPEDLEMVFNALNSCPEPADARCSCPAHQQFSRQDSYGAWDGLSGITRPRLGRLAGTNWVAG